MIKKAFTLIELLVVISIIALLMAILLPTLDRGRRQARAVMCQSNLRQWGVLIATYAGDHDGDFPDAPPYEDVEEDVEAWDLYGYSGFWDLASLGQTESIWRCPMASKLARSKGDERFSSMGGTFLSWGRLWPDYEGSGPWDRFAAYGSYCINRAIANNTSFIDRNDAFEQERTWRTHDVKGKDNIPLQIDGAWPSLYSFQIFDLPPPEYDGIPTCTHGNSVCINRHDGTVNALFLDFSVRKVGLKELWILKWHKLYKTREHWTIAGGVTPADWPKWMRAFRDY